MNRKIILWIVVLLIAFSVFYIESNKGDARRGAGENSDIAAREKTESVDEKEKIYERAKEISTPDGFINTEPVKIADLIGEKIILVDFWTYSCINCQRTLPYLNQWHDKYADEGLVIIGLHTPEFEFEKDIQNVKRAVDKFGVKYPVVLDNDYSTWAAYQNQYWPRKYLIDIDGFIVYDHIGEGAYAETEAKIVELLNERKRISGESDMVSLKIETPDGAESVNFSEVRTPETYLGWGRAEYLANLPSSECVDRVCNFVLPSELAPNTYVLGGDWKIERESAVLESESGVIGIAFSAGKVNLVVDTEEGAVAEIYLDGKKIADIEFNNADLYNIVDLAGEYSLHILEIRIKGKGFSAFAFTFG